MARAKVVLKGALTYARGGVTFRKGQEQEVTGEAEILRYERDQRFLVQRLKEPKAKPEEAAPKEASTEKAKPSSGRKPSRPRSGGGGS